MDRVAVISSGPGAGKTLFARRLAEAIGAPHVELDALFWGPNWRQVEPEEYRRRVGAAAAKSRWVLDGNYRSVRDLVWPRADTLVWLDYPLWVSFSRLLWRTLSRWRDRTELWPGTGNRESLRLIFLSRDSILLWALTTWRGRRKRFEGDIARPEHAHLAVLRLRSTRQAEAWLATQFAGSAASTPSVGATIARSSDRNHSQ